MQLLMERGAGRRFLAYALSLSLLVMWEAETWWTASVQSKVFACYWCQIMAKHFVLLICVIKVVTEF